MSALSKPEFRSLQVEILDLRHFSSADLRPLLEDEVREWSRVLSWDYAGSAEMILRYVDAKILPGYAAIERGRILGYAFFVYEGSKGVIGDLFVASSGRLPDPHEVESRLLLHVIETLQQSPGIHRVEAQLLVHEAGVVAKPARISTHCFVPFVTSWFKLFPRPYNDQCRQQAPRQKRRGRPSGALGVGSFGAT